MTKKALLIFTKNAEPGKVKTRLAATVGKMKAFSVFNQLVEHTISVTWYLPVDKIVFYSEFIPTKDGWDDVHYDKKIQEGGDLGERMAQAFLSTFHQGYDSVVIIGTDCPDINAGLIMNAFEYLLAHDMVIGPAADGGYYLLGMNRFFPNVFENIDWSTEKVFDQTITICNNYNINYSILPLLHDIDKEDDLKHLETQN